MPSHKFDIILPPQDIACAPGLVTRLANGDREAFAWIYRNYCKKFFTYAMLITSDETLSEDIVQETFIKLWRYRKKLTDIENFNGYVHMINRNCVLDMMKHEKREKDKCKEQSQLLSDATSSAADEWMQYKETFQSIKTAINALPAIQQRIFYLREQGIQRGAIAKHLNKTEHSVKGHINRTLHSIKERLDLTNQR